MSKVDYQEFTTKQTDKTTRRKKGVGDIWNNSVKCSNCLGIIRSTNKHDFVWCECGNVAVDGGSWYLKRCGGEKGYTELSESFEDT